MSEAKLLATAEFYTSDIYDHMIGAIDVPAKRMFEAAEALGRLVCKIRKLNSVAVIYYNQDGREINRDLIYR